jgi:hypothetical protein
MTGEGAGTPSLDLYYARSLMKTIMTRKAVFE